MRTCPGSIAATAFVNWYSGHPDFTAPYSLEATSAIVIGLGNVAIDVARVIVRDAEEMAATDVPDDVLDVLRASTLKEVHIVGRRGPEHAKFTIKELREMGELAGVDVIVDPAQVDDLPDFEDKDVKRNVEVFKEWAERKPSGRREAHAASCTSTRGPRRSSAPTTSRRCGASGPTERRTTSPRSSCSAPSATSVRRCRACRSTRPPTSSPTTTIASWAGCVEVGEYTCGWIGRGATGVIGTNRSDAKAAVTSLLADRDRCLRAT